MPTTRVTLAKNSQQTQRSAVLLQLNSKNPAESIAAILSSAEKKLRLRKPTRIFLADGTEITAAEPSSISRITNDSLLLISAGEEFVGIPKQEQQPQQLLPVEDAAPTSVIHSSPEFLQDFVEQLAMDQLKQVARLPGVVRAIGMPDLHPSDKYPIGAIVESRGCIYPVLIGGDVGCGMALFQTSLSSSTRPKRLAERIQGIEGPWVEGSPSEWLARSGITSESEFDQSQLGTIGGGNHFAEIQGVEEILDEERFRSLGLDQDKMVLLVHSGSRGLGKRIAHSQPIRLAENTPEFESYLEQHEHACGWARSNRELIAHRIISRLGSSSSAEKVLDIWHNNVIQKEGVWIHRKGAAPSDQGVVVIPGSRGAMSYLVEPVGDQIGNGFSVAHGAGRRLTRGAALSKGRSRWRGNENAAAAAMEETGLGSRVICEDDELLFEEAPEAYKSVEAVVEQLVELGIVRVVAVYRPVVTYKKRTS